MRSLTQQAERDTVREAILGTRMKLGLGVFVWV
jgi:hypothetical protein